MFLVKVTNSNFMPMLRGFHWYPYFVAQEQLVAICKRVFRVAVNTYVPIFRGLDAHGGRKLRTDPHTHAGQPQ